MLGSLLAFALAAQPAATPGLAGIWEGRVGTLPVRACFTQREWGPFGAYYYLSRLRLVSLEPDEGTTRVFHEGGGDGVGAARWRDVRATATTLTARWTSGARTLPVQLRRVPGAVGEDGPCASLAFHRPRLAGIRIVRTRGSVDGVSYTKLALDTRGRFEIHVTSFALDGAGAAVRRINRVLGGELAGSPPRWFECITNSLGQGLGEGEEDMTVEPAMISRRWLSIADQSFYSCGGAHPDGNSSYRLFDRISGREVDLHDWFTEEAVKRERIGGGAEIFKTLQPAFRAFLLGGRTQPGGRQAADEAECNEVVASQDYWNIGLRRDGLVFTPELPHVVQSCGGEFTVPFDRIRRWLNPAGAAAIAALRAERAPR